MLVCEVIAPNYGKVLFNAMATLGEMDDVAEADDVLKALMSAYKNAKTKSTKTQILSLYAYKYSVSTLKKLHAPYGKLSTRQIQRARCHARAIGPGLAPEEKKYHRFRIDMSKVDHFLEFINRPYFYQDVSYGTTLLKLDSGQTMEMPNVVRTVTRSTMISQYMQFCQEERFEPLSRTTLFKILEVRQASQRKSLQGLDNTAADGSAGFHKIESIVDDLEKGGMDRQWCTEIKERLRNGKRYLKTNFRVHCNPEEAFCPDHCRKFALSDKQDPHFQEKCSHQHTESCSDCQDLRNAFDEVKDRIQSALWIPYSNEEREDLLYDVKLAKADILHWKAHVVRSVNQEAAKQDQLKMIRVNPNCALIIMDWAMKFLQLRYRDWFDWFGKRGLSWHISAVITGDLDVSGKLEMQSYSHLFDACQQDWVAVSSILENTLGELKAKKPHITQVYLRSDEAGCYHNNSLIAAARSVDDFSEPQYGKDVCHRILCPMKTCIRRFCDEGHDILTAGDMTSALSERPVKGTSACVCEVDEAKLTLEVNKIDGFSKLHNVQIDEKTIRVWKSYRIGRGKEISFDQLVTKDQGDTCLIVKEEFFPFHNSRVYQSRDFVAEDSDEGNRHHDLDNSDIEIFECSEPGCVKSFQLFSELEAHLDVGDHRVEAERQSETLYDTIRTDWVERFTKTVNITEDEPCEPVFQSESEPAPTMSFVIMGWALTKQQAGSTRFPEKVKNYLTANFDLGEQSGLKADPQQVSNDMRKARDEQNRRLFEREEWLTKNQVQRFFSRLSANRRRQHAPSPRENEGTEREAQGVGRDMLCPQKLFLDERKSLF